MSSKKKIALALTIPVALLMILAVVSMVSFWSLLRSLPEESHRDRTTDTWSFDFDNRDEKLSFLADYLLAPSEVLDAEYHIVFYDNSGGFVPGPSDWDIRVAVKIHPEDLTLWIDESTEESADEIDLAWWEGLKSDDISWSKDGAIYYRRPGRGNYLVAFPEQSIVLRAISTLYYPTAVGNP